jgi:hypothetical protein
MNEDKFVTLEEQPFNNSRTQNINFSLVSGTYKYRGIHSTLKVCSNPNEIIYLESKA